MFKLKAPATLVFGAALSFLSLVGCNQAAPDNREVDAKALKELDAQWSKTAGSKDLDATLAFYTDDAMVLPGDAPVAGTRQMIREVWAPMLALNASVSWQVNDAEVARSGDVGYARGVYQLVMKDAAGVPATEQGKFLEVWKKQPDGKWKCAIDSFSADAPPPLAPAKK